MKEAEQRGERGAWSVAVWGREAASIALPGLAILWRLLSAGVTGRYGSRINSWCIITAEAGVC